MSNVFKAVQGLSLRLSRSNLYIAQRCLSTKQDVQKGQPNPEPPPEPEITLQDVMRGPIHYPTDFDKKILVFSGKYKKVEDVPKTMTHAAFDKARNKARIKLANYMMLATAIACLGVAISGRRAAERGESVHQMNLDWHKEMNKELSKK